MHMNWLLPDQTDPGTERTAYQQSAVRLGGRRHHFAGGDILPNRGKGTNRGRGTMLCRRLPEASSPGTGFGMPRLSPLLLQLSVNPSCEAASNEAVTERKPARLDCRNRPGVSVGAVVCYTKRPCGCSHRPPLYPKRHCRGIGLLFATAGVRNYS